MKVVGLVLLVLCLVFLVAFSLEILYLVWRRRGRRSHNHNPASRSAGVDPERQGRSETGSDVPGAETAKEGPSSFWLCMFCCKWTRSPTRIEPSSSTSSFPTRQYFQQPHLRPVVDGVEYYIEEDAEVAKARGQYASRELFTIREEEEGTETDSTVGSGRRRPPSVHSGRSIEGATPFATPCGSPMYLTPLSSPPHPAATVAGNGVL